MGGLEVLVKVNDILDIYEKEVSVNTRNKRKIYNFEINKMVNIYDIKGIIESGNYGIRGYNIFFISSPKYRVVMSLSIKDKVINHYVTRYILIPKLDRYLDMRNCATRKGMGYSYGIDLLKGYIEKNKMYDRFYILRIDISKYFYSIDHDILKGLIRDKLDNDEYGIVSSIIDSTNNKYINERISYIKSSLMDKDIDRKDEIDKLPLYEYNKGLPIGNMTSQFLSIFYLYKLDYYIVNTLRLKYMVRYMDDYVIISHDKGYLEEVLIEITRILKDEYNLSINRNKTRIFDSYHGFEYLGYIFCVRDRKTIIKRKVSNRKRMVNGIKRSKYLYTRGYLSYRSFFNSISNYYGNLNGK